MLAYQIGKITRFMRCRAVGNSIFKPTLPMYQINAILPVPSLMSVSRYSFATTIDINSEQTFNLLIKKLNNLVEHSNELNEMMIDDGTQTIDYSKKQMSKD